MDQEGNLLHKEANVTILIPVGWMLGILPTPDRAFGIDTKVCMFYTISLELILCICHSAKLKGSR